jgi:TPR repeat protein
LWERPRDGKLAHCYRHGVGCAESEPDSWHWRQGALATDDEYAAAFLLEGCELNEKDGAKTFAAMFKAAQNGNCHAQYKVGFMYVTNHGVSHQQGKSTEWFQKAADQNLSVALAALGNAYEKGSGVKADAAKAYYFYERAAIQGHAKATFRVCPFYNGGWPSKIQSGARSVEWAWRAAKIGIKEAEVWVDMLPKEARDHCANVWEQQCVKAAQWWERNGLDCDRKETFEWLLVVAATARGKVYKHHPTAECEPLHPCFLASSVQRSASSLLLSTPIPSYSMYDSASSALSNPCLAESSMHLYARASSRST